MPLPPLQAQTSVALAKARYSNVWRPISVEGIRDGIRMNRNNGVGLEQIMTRAFLQQKSLDYLVAIKALSDTNPKNATLLAGYAWALAQVKNTYSFSDQTSPIPERLTQKFNFSWQNIRDTIQRAKELDSHCWLAYVAEATLEPGGPPPTREAAATKRAFQIERNALTLTRYGSALMFQSAGAQDTEGIRRGQRLLLLAERLYPTYYKSSYEVYGSYLYPDTGSEQKSKEALRRFYNNIPPENRDSDWVVRYLKYLKLEKRLEEIGVTL